MDERVPPPGTSAVLPVFAPMLGSLRTRSTEYEEVTDR